MKLHIDMKLRFYMKLRLELSNVEPGTGLVAAIPPESTRHPGETKASN
jgi:hypothetical protein